MRKRAGKTRSIAEALSTTTRPLFRSRGFADGAIFAHWPAIVGEALSAVCLPERVVFPPRTRSGGTLRLRVASGGLAVELQHLQPQLIERINTYFGYDAVARLQFLHGPLPKRRERGSAAVRPLTEAEQRQLADLVSGIDDAQLRQALADCGRAVLGRRPQH
jgi:hypothetical protein